MADFNRRKLQVFVSTTFNDLVNERQAAVEAILTAGHFPAGMELFASAGESRMPLIKQWIDESDVYLLILGGNYGGLEPGTGKSFPHLEYEYAISKDKPVFAYLIRDVALAPRLIASEGSALQTNHPQKLRDFRAAVLAKTAKFWDDAKDIQIAVAETLALLAQRNDLVGWVRAGADESAPSHGQTSTTQIQEDRINDLSFLELKTILDRVGASQFLIDHKHELNSAAYGIGVVAGENPQFVAASELSLRGLLVQNMKINNGALHYFLLTEDGRTYINQFEARQLAAQTPPPPETGEI